ncbi:MAG: SDR family NAD(P)-dependent oxidoreductase [Desulfobacterales bacterium]|jgi:NAD(P)-dependent dehydrogenase (short-subunit alcohol dehydrogenase family)
MSAPPVVIVTGASRGIGAAIVNRLRQARASVVAVARSSTAAGSAKSSASHGERVHPIAADIADPGACADVVRETLGTFGRLDALVNNAGILAPVSRIADADPGAWQYNLAVNLLGPFYLSRAAVPHLRAVGGRIVNISSGAAVKAIQGWSAYCVAKAALTHFTRQLAAEEPAITSVALRPGVVDTAMQELIRQAGPSVMTPDKSAYFQALKDRGQLLAPEIPARAAAWLALAAPAELSGAFIDYDDPRLAAAYA